MELILDRDATEMPEVIKEIQDNGGSVSGIYQHNRDGFSPLFWASRYGFCAGVKLLLEAKADIEERTVYGDATALHEAAQAGRPDVVAALLDKGADINAKSDRKNNEQPDYCNKTPLHLAAEGGHSRVVRLLLERGADINAVTLSNETPFHLAGKGGMTEVGIIMLAHPGINLGLCSNPNEYGPGVLAKDAFTATELWNRDKHRLADPKVQERAVALFAEAQTGLKRLNACTSGDEFPHAFNLDIANTFNRPKYAADDSYRFCITIRGPLAYSLGGTVAHILSGSSEEKILLRFLEPVESAPEDLEDDVAAVNGCRPFELREMPEARVHLPGRVDLRCLQVLTDEIEESGAFLDLLCKAKAVEVPDRTTACFPLIQPPGNTGVLTRNGKLTGEAKRKKMNADQKSFGVIDDAGYVQDYTLLEGVGLGELVKNMGIDAKVYAALRWASRNQ